MEGRGSQMADAGAGGSSMGGGEEGSPQRDVEHQRRAVYGEEAPDAHDRSGIATRRRGEEGSEPAGGRATRRRVVT